MSKLWGHTELKVKFLHQIGQVDELGSWRAEVVLAKWTKCMFQSRSTIIPANSWSRKKQLKLKNLVLRIGDRLALRKLMPQAIKAPRQYATLKAHFTFKKLSGILFQNLKDIIHFFKQLSRRSGRNSYDIAIKEKEILTGLCTGIQFIQYYWNNVAANWDIIIHSEIGFKQSMKQEKVRVLCEIPKSSDLCPCNSRTYWWTHDFIRIDGPRWNSIKLEEVHVPHGSPWIWILLWTEDSLLEEKHRKEEDGWFSSHFSIHLGKILKRKHLENPSQYPEKYIIEIPGEAIRTLCIG